MDESVHGLSKRLGWIAMGLLVALMVLPVVNIGMRLFPLTKPLKGTFELVGFISGILASFSLAQCAVQRGHIMVDLVFSRLPQGIQSVIDGMVSILSAGICLLIVWQSGKYAVDMWKAGETSMTLHIPLSAVVLGVACGFAVLCLVYLVDLFRVLARVAGK